MVSQDILHDNKQFYAIPIVTSSINIKPSKGENGPYFHIAGLKSIRDIYT